MDGGRAQINCGLNCSRFEGYDVIFGMDLLSTLRAVMDCFRKRITL